MDARKCIYMHIRVQMCDRVTIWYALDAFSPPGCPLTRSQIVSSRRRETLAAHQPSPTEPDVPVEEMVKVEEVVEVEGMVEVEGVISMHLCVCAGGSGWC